MKAKPRFKKNKDKYTAHILVALICLSFGVLSVGRTHAAGPGNAAVEMTFSEVTGTTTTNSGFLAGLALFDPGTTTNGFPTFTNNVPSGTYTPAGNTYALNMGAVDTTGGGRKVDLTTDNGPLGTLGGFVGGLTVCGWLNSVNNGVGSGGNRIAFALESPNGLGFDLMQRNSGSLGFNVNQYNDSGPVSSLGMITENAGAATTNWTFFAVTYNPALSSGQVKFYFGRADRLAGFDTAVTYAGGITNEIEYTGKLTVGNFSAVEGANTATGTGSRTYRGLIDQLRVFTNILNIDEIQQVQLESGTVPAVAATITRQPTNVTVTAAPFKTASFSVEANGSGLVTYQWLTNGVAVANATNASFTLPADSITNNGKIINVYVDNALTPDPGVLSSNATLTIIVPPTADLVILPNDDVFVDNSGGYNAWSQSQQVNWGLAGANGVATGQRRSYIEFTLGTNLAAAVKFKIWNYWGGPAVNGEGRLAQATTRIYGTTNAPLQITEPPVGTHSDPSWIAPNNTNFVAIPPDKVVGPDIGWYEFDITSWYNARRGQTTTLVLRGAAISGFDFPIYEDREGTAFTAGAGGTLTNTGPRLDVFLAPPLFVSSDIVGTNLILNGYYGKPGSNYVLLSSSDIALPLTNWSRVLTNQFDASGNFHVTNSLAPAPSKSFYRLLLP
ncbi:MAG: hypothetical protein V9H26_14020 [Verrucomicrobiota bacterium]|nr:hypothetical protein [Verrucomicrobiota bacterium]